MPQGAPGAAPPVDSMNSRQATMREATMREECDHFYHTAGLINDQQDAFLDGLLPAGRIEVAEEGK